jgi:hypothetical protein
MSKSMASNVVRNPAMKSRMAALPWIGSIADPAYRIAGFNPSDYTEQLLGSTAVR